jgi:hypothetical protein
MDDLSDMVYPHIDYFIHIGRSGWDIDCFSFDGDPIYDIEGNFEIRNAKVFTLEGFFYTWTINTFGILVMILLQTFSIHQGMACHNEIMLNPNHTLGILLLKMWPAQKR